MVEDKINNVQFLNLNHPEIVIAIIFGLIASVLTLVGLISIFVSLNSQHSIQKCREIFWGLLQETNKEEIKKKLSLYSDILGDNEKFTPRVILLVNVTILIVMLISGALIWTLWSDFNTNERWIIGGSVFFIYVIFIWFGGTLLSLKFIDRVSSLPSMIKLLDGDKETKVNTSALVANTLEMKLILYKDKFYFQFMTTIPVNNIEIILSKFRLSLTEDGVIDRDLCYYNEENSNEAKSHKIVSDTFEKRKEFADSINNGVYFVAPLIEDKKNTDYLYAWVAEHNNMDLSISSEIIVTDKHSHVRIVYEMSNLLCAFKAERVSDRELMYSGKEKDIDFKKEIELIPNEIIVQRESYDKVINSRMKIKENQQLLC